MPNLIMEYTHSVDERINVQSLLEDLHNALIESQYFEVNSIQSRAMRLHQWLVGELSDSVDFIHVTLEPLEGLSAQQKSTLSEQLMAILSEQAAHVQSLTVKIRDIQVSGYSRVTCF